MAKKIVYRPHLFPVEIIFDELCGIRDIEIMVLFVHGDTLDMEILT